jgi:hypothetical protein
MTEVLTDAKGRKLTLRKLTVLDQARMLRAIGSRDPKQAQNQPYVQLVECACMVEAIDGVPVVMPNNEAQIDALLGKLGDEGTAVLFAHRTAEIQRVMKEAEAALEGGGGAPDSPLSKSAPS